MQVALVQCSPSRVGGGGGAIKKWNVSELHEPSKKGHEYEEDDERSGRVRSHRTDKNVEKVRRVVHSDSRFKYQSYGCATKFRQKQLRMQKKAWASDQRVDSPWQCSS
jgi:hypothetical protein